jgi:hypothetical protein
LVYLTTVEAEDHVAAVGPRHERDHRV